MWKGGKNSETLKKVPTRKAKTAMVYRQNNRMLRQCPFVVAPQPPHHTVAVPTAMQNSHKDNVHSSAIGKQLKQKKSNSLYLQPSTTSLLLISSGLTSSCESSSAPSSWSRLDSPSRLILPGLTISPDLAWTHHLAWSCLDSPSHLISPGLTISPDLAWTLTDHPDDDVGLHVLGCQFDI